MRSGRIWREMEVRRLRICKIRIHENRLADERMDILSIVFLPFFKLTEFQIVFGGENAQQHAVRLVLPPEVVVAVDDFPQIRMVQDKRLDGVAEDVVADDDIARRRRHLIGEQMA